MNKLDALSILKEGLNSDDYGARFTRIGLIPLDHPELENTDPIEDDPYGIEPPITFDGNVLVAVQAKDILLNIEANDGCLNMDYKQGFDSMQSWYLGEFSLGEIVLKPCCKDCAWHGCGTNPFNPKMCCSGGEFDFTETEDDFVCKDFDRASEWTE